MSSACIFVEHFWKKGHCRSCGLSIEQHAIAPKKDFNQRDDRQQSVKDIKSYYETLTKKSVPALTIRPDLAKKQSVMARFSPTPAQKPELRFELKHDDGRRRTKDAATHDMIVRAVMQNLLFKHIDKQQTETIVKEMWFEDVPSGTALCKQGARGDTFYVVHAGEFRVIVDQHAFPSLRPGQSFGELALMASNHLRRATAVAVCPSSVWVVDFATVRAIIAVAASAKLQEYEHFLDNVQAFHSLFKDERAKLAEALEPKFFIKGQHIVLQGEEGETFYILRQGQVGIGVRDENTGEDIQVAVYSKPGDYFGELSLRKKEKRAATVTALCDVEVLMLHAASFTMLLGRMEDIFQTRVVEYVREVHSNHEKARSRSNSLTHTPNLQPTSLGLSTGAGLASTPEQQQAYQQQQRYVSVSPTHAAPVSVASSSSATLSGGAAVITHTTSVSTGGSHINVTTTTTAAIPAAPTRPPPPPPLQLMSPTHAPANLPNSTRSASQSVAAANPALYSPLPSVSETIANFKQQQRAHAATVTTTTPAPKIGHPTYPGSHPFSPRNTPKATVASLNGTAVPPSSASSPPQRLSSANIPLPSHPPPPTPLMVHTGGSARTSVTSPRATPPTSRTVTPRGSTASTTAPMPSLAAALTTTTTTTVSSSALPAPSRRPPSPPGSRVVLAPSGALSPSRAGAFPPFSAGTTAGFAGSALAGSGSGHAHPGSATYPSTRSANQSPATSITTLTSTTSLAMPAPTRAPPSIPQHKLSTSSNPHPLAMFPGKSQTPPPFMVATTTTTTTTTSVPPLPSSPPPPVPPAAAAAVTQHALASVSSPSSSSSSLSSHSSLVPLDTSSGGSLLDKAPAEALSPVSTPEKEQLKEEKHYSLADFNIIGTLGRGAFGHVQLVTERSASSKTYALKTVNKMLIVECRQVRQVVSEKTVLSLFHHPFIVQLRGTFKDADHLYFLLEPCLGGELANVLKHQRKISEDSTKFIAASIVLVFEYMHSKGVVYRDLKPENILLDSEGNIKITDFGFAKHIDDHRTHTLCGTADYLAPEVVSGQGHGLAVDWWTLGILIFELITGEPPFFDENPLSTYERILAGTVHYPTTMSAEVVDLCKKLLTKSTQRLGAIVGGPTLIKLHPWFRDIDWDALAARKVKPPIVPQVKGATDLSNFTDEMGDDERWKPWVPEPGCDPDPFRDF